MSTITVFRPVDASEPPTTVELAPRGELPPRPVIGIVDNRKPNARRILEILADELGQRLGDCEIVLMQKKGAGNPMPPEMADDMAARAHLVITGVGDWGACSSCSLHDAVLLEERGTPATVLITEPFQGIVATSAARLGAPGYHSLVVPHPIWSKDDDGLRVLARQIVDNALAQLTTVGAVAVAPRAR